MTATIYALFLAAETEEEPSGIDLILPDPAELLWGAITFAVVAFVLTRMAFPKLREAVEKRERAIREANEAAERERQEAQREREEYRRQLANARAEANRVIEDARGQAEQVRRDIIAKAEKDAEAIVARAQEQIEAERTRTIQELQGTIANLSIQLAEKVVGRSLDGGAQRDLVDSYIREVAGMTPTGNGRTA